MADGACVSGEIRNHRPVMALYLTRAGRKGEHELKFLNDGRIYFTWGGLVTDLNVAQDLPGYYELFSQLYPDEGKGAVQNWARQGMQFCRAIQPGDWVAMPSKLNPTIHFGKVLGACDYQPNLADIYRNSRKIDWFAQDIPRTRFDQDILYSLGAFLTVCKIQRNNAEARIKEMAANGWQVPSNSKATIAVGASIDDEADQQVPIDLETTAYDQISKLIMARFKGHGLATLVKAILQTEGYTVHQPPEGPDHGVDLLAAPGGLGFGQPRICVQVKSGDSPLERVVLDQLVGTMQNHQAQHGLLVSWGGFKQSIEKDRASQFFRVRLWNRDELITNLLACYDRLDEEIRTKLPLKRIWCLAGEED
jgi:restriction system protein